MKRYFLLTALIAGLFVSHNAHGMYFIAWVIKKAADTTNFGHFSQDLNEDNTNCSKALEVYQSIALRFQNSKNNTLERGNGIYPEVELVDKNDYRKKMQEIKELIKDIPNENNGLNENNKIFFTFIKRKIESLEEDQTISSQENNAILFNLGTNKQLQQNQTLEKLHKVSFSNFQSDLEKIAKEIK